MNIVDINNERQNHPELVARDLSPYVPSELVREVLKRRGINKWLRVRRLLIQLKTSWKTRIQEVDAEKAEARHTGDMRRYRQLVGYQQCLIDCRQQVRALCHSPRDVDFPETPRDFGDVCLLPADFPVKPHKRWFWARTNRYEEALWTQKSC